MSRLLDLQTKVVNLCEERGIVNPTLADIKQLAGPDVDPKFFNDLVNLMLESGPLTPLLKDPSITEVMVNGPKNIYIEKNGKLEKTNLEFENEAALLGLIDRFVSRVGRRIDAASPMVDARLPDGARVNAIIAPLSLVGPVLTIRRFPVNPPTLDDLVDRGTLTPSMASFLRDAITAKLNIVISGGTGSGKTTTLNALASEISQEERIVTVEDSAEMRITHNHLVGLESRPANLEGKGEVPVRSLVKNALRMRPDRIIVGEIRGGEALDMLQAMNTGHQGSLTTVHSNSPLEALFRIETMTLMADVELPLFAIRQQVEQALQVIVQQERLTDGSRKVVSIEIIEPVRSDSYQLVPVYMYDKTLKKFGWVGKDVSINKLLAKNNLSVNPQWKS